MNEFGVSNRQAGKNLANRDSPLALAGLVVNHSSTLSQDRLALTAVTLPRLVTGCLQISTHESACLRRDDVERTAEYVRLSVRCTRFPRGKRLRWARFGKSSDNQPWCDSRR